jgi:hypothetical protein
MNYRSTLFLFISLISNPLLAEVSIESDRFTGDTTIVARQRPFLGTYPCLRPGAVWTSVLGHDAVEQPSVVMLSFEATCAGWLYLECHHVHALKDGQPYSLPDSEHKGNVLSTGSVNESVRLMLTLDQVKDLAAAKALEFRICNTEIKFKKKELQDIGGFIKAIEASIRKMP